MLWPWYACDGVGDDDENDDDYDDDDNDDDGDDDDHDDDTHVTNGLCLIFQEVKWTTPSPKRGMVRWDNLDW